MLLSSLVFRGIKGRETCNYLKKSVYTMINIEFTAFRDKHQYSGDLKSGLIWILNGQEEVGLEMVWITNGI